MSSEKIASDATNVFIKAPLFGAAVVAAVALGLGGHVLGTLVGAPGMGIAGHKAGEEFIKEVSKGLDETFGK